MTLIQIRGTSGSGKTTVTKELMNRLGGWVPHMQPPRKKPLYYVNDKDIVVLGHYEIDCGGCDTIGSAPKVYEVIKDIECKHSISEGLLWSEDVKWTLQLRDVHKKEILCVFLTTDLDECLRRVKIRQDGREPIDPARVVRKLSTRIGTIDRARIRLVQAGVKCLRLSSQQAPDAIMKYLT